MGYYVNPRNESKESFLKQHGLIAPENFKWHNLPKGMLPVILINNNGQFNAAGIAYSESELRAFTDPDDPRPRKIFLVSIAKLLEVSDEDFCKYVQKNLIIT